MSYSPPGNILNKVPIILRSFLVLRQALSKNNGKYIDENDNSFQTLDRIVIVNKEGIIWVSTFRSGDLYMYCRPLLIMADGTLMLRDLPDRKRKVSDLTPYSWSYDNNYQCYHWFTMSYDEFMVGKNPIINYDDVKVTITVNTCYQMNEEYTRDMVIFHPMKSSQVVDDVKDQELYDRIITLDERICSKYLLFPGIYSEFRLRMVDGEVKYYLCGIQGNVEETKEEFECIVQDRKFVMIKGDWNTLSKALDQTNISSEYFPHLKVYRRRECHFIENEIHKWMITGCPDLDFEYKLTTYQNEISLSYIRKDEVKVDFVGLGNIYLEIDHIPTGRKWEFTGQPYAHVKVEGQRGLQSSSNCYQEKGDRESKFVTPQLKQQAINLIFPIYELLKSI